MSALAAGRQPSASTDEIEVAEDDFEASSTPAILRGGISTSTVDIDGVDWHLTTLLITIDALLVPHAIPVSFNIAFSSNCTVQETRNGRRF